MAKITGFWCKVKLFLDFSKGIKRRKKSLLGCQRLASANYGNPCFSNILSDGADAEKDIQYYKLCRKKVLRSILTNKDYEYEILPSIV